MAANITTMMTIRLQTLVPWAILVAFTCVLAGLFLGIVTWGHSYYVLELVARDRHELHPVLAPGGSVGMALGLLGTGLMVAMLAYSVRKSLVRSTWLGSTSHWLRFHIVCGVMGPLFILLHSSFHLPRGMIAVGFWCMVLVALSGGFGRYVYSWFPRMEGGRELAWDEAAAQLTDLRIQLVASTASEHGPSIGQAVALVRDLDFQATSVLDLVWLRWEVFVRWRTIRGLLRRSDLEHSARASAQATLAAQLRLKAGLESMRVAGRLFRYWHLFHRPLASAMYLIVALHILGVFVFGRGLEPLLTSWG